MKNTYRKLLDLIFGPEPETINVVDEAEQRKQRLQYLAAVQRQLRKEMTREPLVSEVIAAAEEGVEEWLLRSGVERWSDGIEWTCEGFGGRSDDA